MNRRLKPTVLFGMLALTLCASMPSAISAPRANSGLTGHDKDLYENARARGAQTVMVLIASKPGANTTVVNGLNKLGAVIRYRDDTLGYVRAIVGIESVPAASKLAGVQTFNLDELIEREPVRAGLEPGDETAAVPTPPGPTTLPSNSQMPTRDTGAVQFVQDHPTYDGRGTKVAIVDSGVDILTPELQDATAADGSTVRKIIDWVNFNDPLSGEDPSWVDMTALVSVAGGQVTVDGVTYTGIAADGTYRFGIFDEALIPTNSDYYLPGGCQGGINRDADCNDKFAVLWRTSDNRVWVDTNADHDFTGEPGLQDYKVAFEHGLFGTDNPATARRESVPFVIQTDGKDKFVNIGVAGSEHATHVAGIATGSNFFGGAFDGAAPGAQVVSVRVCTFGTSCTSHGLIEGMIYAAKQANVDVINMSIGGLPSLNDGNNTRAVLYNRLIDESKVEMFLSAGNSYAGINSVGDPSVATDAMSVGAYVHADTWFDNYGATVPKVDGIFPFSSRGPSEAGALKPQIIAPGSAVSCVPAWAPNFPLVGPLPIGYDMFNGTSMAAPQAAGAAALLISAAKQSGVQYKPDQLRQAINSSARYIAGYDAYEQGNGLFQVPAAWDLLKTNIKTVGITSVAPVDTVLKGFLATPGFGTGIYEREGWAPGNAGTRNIVFTRTSGGTKPVTYNLSWVGNDGTFSSAGSVALGLNNAASVAVNINAATAGPHSAILQLDDSSTTGVDYEVLNTIVAAGQFNAGNNFSVSFTGSIDRADTQSFFWNVPVGAPAFKIDVTGISGRIRFLRYHPYGVAIDSTALAFQTGGTQTRTLSAPLPGVWEAMVETSRTAVPAQSTFTITGSILGVTATPSPWVISPATVGTTYNQLYTFTNPYGAFTGNATGTNLASTFETTGNISAGGADQVYPVTVTAGASSIAAQLTGSSDPAADLDLFLFDCTAGPCVLKASSTSGSSVESVSSNAPAAGLWVVLVNAFGVPSGNTNYGYLDTFTNAAFGAVSFVPPDPSVLHPSGSNWNANAQVTPLVAPATGRYLRGFVNVTAAGSQFQVRLQF